MSIVHQYRPLAHSASEGKPPNASAKLNNVKFRANPNGGLKARKSTMSNFALPLAWHYSESTSLEFRLAIYGMTCLEGKLTTTNFSMSHAIRRFRASCRHRLEAVKKLLATTDRSIRAISEACGNCRILQYLAEGERTAGRHAEFGRQLLSEKSSRAVVNAPDP